MKLVKKLTISGVVFTILPLLTVLAFFMTMGTRMLQVRAAEAMISLRDSMARFVETSMVQEKRILQNFYSDQMVQKGVEMMTLGDVSNLSQYYFNRYSTIYHDISNYEGFFITDLNGNIIADTAGGILKGINISKEDFFQRAKKRQTVIGSMDLSRQSPYPVVYIVSPLSQIKGQGVEQDVLVGVMGVRLRLEYINNRLNEVKVGRTGFAFIVDDQGKMISHPDKNLLMKTNIQDLEGFEEIASRILASKGGFVEIGPLNKRIMIAYTPIQDTPWKLILVASKSEYMEIINSVRNMVLGVGIIFLMLSIVGVRIFSRIISEPIVKLQEDVELIGKGDLDYKVNPVSNDEIGQLSQAFGKMTESLKKSQEKLIQSEKMAGIGQLAAGVAHDFNNVLTGIIQFTEFIMLDTDPGSDIHQDASMILKGAKHAAELTNQLLAFSRRQIMETRVINLNELVIKMDKMLNYLVRDDIELKIITSADLKPVEVDPSQIERIIVNLVVNACDAMPRGGSITIKTNNEYFKNEQTLNNEVIPPGEYALMSVADSGEGMNDEVKEHLFEPFFTTKEEGEGSGLGLASVYGIVKQHKGHLTFISEIGKGTEFNIYFPVVKSDIGDSVAEEKDVDNLKGDETVLVVEDNALSRKAIIKVLKRLGYNVLSASDGEMALRKVEQNNGSIDILITDVVMPKMSGKELATHLQSRYNDLKVLFISGYTDSIITHDGILDKDVNFLQKPFTDYQLASKIYSILGKQV